MTNLEQMAEMVKDLPLDEPCPLCHDEGLILCPDHILELDGDGDLWCGTCDTGFDEPQLRTCPCNWED